MHDGGDLDVSTGTYIIVAVPVGVALAALGAYAAQRYHDRRRP